MLASCKNTIIPSKTDGVLPRPKFEIRNLKILINGPTLHPEAEEEITYNFNTLPIARKIQKWIMSGLNGAINMLL